MFKKCRENPEDVLFIDASAHYEKAKNQNVLRDSDIEKIVATYRGRLVEDKYSYRAGLDEIRENEFNLNIPRYVDTFAEEDAVDLGELSAQLQTLDAGMAATDRTIADFCRQLNIPTPF